MHILIATAGVLPPQPVAEIVELLLTGGGRVTVITVIGVPRSFLDALRSEEWRPMADTSWPEHQDAVISRYVEERGKRLTEPLLAALEGQGITPQVHYLEGEDKAQTIIEAANELDATLVVLGATRQIFAESAWESISARVMRDLGRPVLIVPPTRTAQPADDGESPA